MNRKIKFKNALVLPRNGNYFNFRDKHIIVGWRDYDVELMKELVPVNGGTRVRIHIFINELTDILDTLSTAINGIIDQTKYARVIIHIPSRCMDLKDVLIDKIEVSRYPRIQVVVDKKKELFFRINEKEKGQAVYKLCIKYTDNRVECSVLTFWGHMMRVDDTAAVQNVVQKQNPDRYKDRIIANFKANTPLGLLKSFKDEEDIWKYINNEEEWLGRKKPVQTIHVSPVTIDLTEEMMSDQDKAVAHVGETVGQQALNAIFKAGI